METRRRSKSQQVNPATMSFSLIVTVWGPFGVVLRDGRVVATYLPHREADLRRAIRSAYPGAVEYGDAPRGLRPAVESYFAGRKTAFTVAIDCEGLPDFRRSVLEACRRIPFGATASYADLARAVGRPGATRAVGSAMAHNPLPLIVPCHRVLRSDGSLGGFSSPEGRAQKIRMLLLENPSIQLKRSRAHR